MKKWIAYAICEKCAPHVTLAIEGPAKSAKAMKENADEFFKPGCHKCDNPWTRIVIERSKS